MSHILFESLEGPSQNKVAVLTLNAEKSLNSISLEMIESLTEHLRSLQNDATYKAIVLRGAGEKAFCAGGDIRKLYEGLVNGNRYFENFFLKEYSLDYFIHQFPKPLIVWGHGIVMGGGLGLMIGAKHRIVTERTLLAMPEISIGLFPDVGGSYFLNKAPGLSGLYLGLTGTRLNADDCLYAGFADYKLNSQDYSKFLDLLKNAKWQNNEKQNQLITKEIISSLSQPEAQSVLKTHQKEIATLCETNSLEQIAKNFQSTLPNAKDWIKKGIETFQKGSPTSAHLIFEQLKRTQNMELKNVFDFELGMAYRVCEHHDFKEGVRALLIDRDNQPKWSPGTLSEVSPSLIEEHFNPVQTKIKEYV